MKVTNFYLFSKEQFEVILTFGLCLIGWENGRRNLGLKGGFRWSWKEIIHSCLIGEKRKEKDGPFASLFTKTNHLLNRKDLKRKWESLSQISGIYKIIHFSTFLWAHKCKAIACFISFHFSPILIFRLPILCYPYQAMP